MNKKKIFGSIVILAIAAMAAFNVNVNTQEEGLSDISLENMEALAEEASLATTCNYYGCRLSLWYDCRVYILSVPIHYCPHMYG
jgi:hypothetical protein